MPKMGGRELAHRVQARRRGLRVLYMSGHDKDHPTQVADVDVGTRILWKPFSIEDLTRHLHEVLDAPP
jgi:CheY-like chemotaxis protein